jgi:glycosyltransferase involved in cell wall biosynthesis
MLVRHTLESSEPEIGRPVFSVVIPCFNEEGGARETVASLIDSLRGARSFEVILVDDGSTDGTARILDELAEVHDEVRVLRHGRNRGYGAALKTGIRNARADLIAITDADGTYPNERIPELVEAAQDADMVVGARTGEDVTYSKLRASAKVWLRMYASWIAGQNIPDINSGMRVFRKSVAEQFLRILPDTFSFTTTITLAMLTNYQRVRYIPISYAKRVGKSKIKPVRDTVRFVQLIVRTGMYFAPLRMLAPFVVSLFICFLGSFGYDVFVRNDLTEATLLFFLATFNTLMLALLADMIDKRNPK